MHTQRLLEKYPMIFERSQGAFSPAQLGSNLGAWIDPIDLPTMLRVPAWKLLSGQWLTTPHTANLLVTTQFTLEVWVQNWANNNDVCFASKGLYSSSAGWCALGAANSASASAGSSASVNLFTGTAANVYSRATGVLQTMQKPLSHFVIRYNAGTVTILRNGVADTVTGSAAAAIVADAMPFLIGGKFHSSHNTFQGLIGCVRFWNTDIGSTDALGLWTGGYNALWGVYSYIPYSSLSSNYTGSNLQIALDGYSGDFKTCQKTGRVFTDGGTASSSAYACLAITDRGTFGCKWKQDFGGAAHWNPTGLNGTPCLETYQENSNASVSKYASQGLAATVANLFKTARGSLTAAHGMKSRNATEAFFISSEGADSNSDFYYLYYGWENQSGTYKPFIRLSDGYSGSQRNVTGPYAQVSNAANTNYVYQWHQNGAAWTFRRNNIAQTITFGIDGPGGNAQTTFGTKVTTQQKSSLMNQNCFVASTNGGVMTTGMMEPQRLGTIITSKDTLSAATLAKLQTYVNAKHNNIYA
jgi:hypothetical protein